MKNKGFTLIELLVVVAIIGILATVVTASLGSSRSKSQDASIKAQLRTIVSQAELWYLEKDSYFTVPHYVGNSSSSCSNSYALASTMFGDSTIQAAILKMDGQNGSYNVSCKVREQSNGSSSYSLSVQDNTGTHVCIDSSSNTVIVGERSSDNGTIVYCAP